MKSVLDDFKMDFEDIENKTVKPKSSIKLKDIVKAEKQVSKALKPKRFNPVKEYFNYIIEVILA